jgi:hypothetical protein
MGNREVRSAEFGYQPDFEGAGFYVARGVRRQSSWAVREDGAGRPGGFFLLFGLALDKRT